MIIFATFLNAAMIGTAKKHQAGTLLFTAYSYDFQADIIRDNSSNISTDKFDWREETYILRPVYYTENFLFHLTIPYRKQQRGITQEEVSGLYDMSAGVGYFIPNSFGDLLWVSTIQFPTGEYDENKPKIYGVVDALQLGLDRYEIQEELHFFKPLLDTKIPFLFDASFLYHYRFDNLHTKAKNGYFLGLETTISAVLTPNFFIGPALYYKKYNEEEAVTPNVGSSKYQFGFDALYKIDANSSLTFEYVQDINVKNRAQGDRFTFRYVYKFDIVLN